MTRWRSQHYIAEGKKKNIEAAVLQHAALTAKAITACHPDLPPVFTLRHLADLTGVEYGVLRSIVMRNKGASYRTFQIHKRGKNGPSNRYRVISVPSPPLMRVQRWINRQILMLGKTHQASTAYAEECTVIAAAESHCGSDWLIKLDITSFFESINEISVYRVFRSLGYQPLVSFEMARLCTRMRATTSRAKMLSKWRIKSRAYSIIWYEADSLGYLPQGAPSSPMLANLVAKSLDSDISKIADEYGLIYTRYADDITLSKVGEFDRSRCSSVIGKVFSAMARHGFSPNFSKTKISPPGARKVVLGLLVDGHRPKLSREFRDTMRRHLYYLTKESIGPVAHARARGFDSVSGLRHHLRGLLSYARQIEPGRANLWSEELGKVKWPL